MSLLGILLDKYGPVPAPPAPPAAPTAGSTPVTAMDAGAAAGSSSGNGTSSGGTGSGTPVSAPATRHAFALRDATGKPEERGRAYALAGHRTWRMADVLAAISGGPRAQVLIEAASRPGPVQPGSLLEAIKALHPAPTLPTRTV